MTGCPNIRKVSVLLLLVAYLLTGLGNRADLFLCFAADSHVAVESSHGPAVPKADLLVAASGTSVTPSPQAIKAGHDQACFDVELQAYEARQNSYELQARADANPGPHVVSDNLGFPTVGVRIASIRLRPHEWAPLPPQAIQFRQSDVLLI